MSSLKPVPCICLVKLGTLERDRKGVKDVLRMLILLFLLGSVLGEDGVGGKFDLCLHQ